MSLGYGIVWNLWMTSEKHAFMADQGVVAIPPTYIAYHGA